MAITTRKFLAKALASLIEDSRIGTLTSIINDPGGPRPVGQYVMVNFMQMRSIGKDGSQFTDEVAGPDLVETTEGFREIWFSVKVYRDDALDQAEAIRLSLRKHWARQEMLTSGMALARIAPDIRDISEIEDAGREQIGQFDVYYNTIQSLTDIVFSIESIEISGKYEGQFDPVDTVINVENP